jgi:hypothetical protein
MIYTQKGPHHDSGVTGEVVLLTAELLRGCEVTFVVGCLRANPQNCSSKMSNALSWCSGQGVDPLHKATNNFLVPINGDSLGGDGVAQLVRVCWVSHGQVVLSRFR